MADYYNLLIGDPDQARAEASALANQIRAKKALEAVGAVAGAGSAGIAAGAKALGGQAAGEEKLLEQGVGTRARYGEERDARASALKQTLENMKAQGLEHKLENDRLREEMRGNFGVLRATIAANAKLQAGAEGADRKEQEKAITELAAFDKRVNPLIASSRSGIGSSAQISRRGRAVIRAIGDQNMTDEQLNQLNPQWVVEAATGLASIVNGGYQPAVTVINKLIPHTLGMTTAQIAQYITSEMTGANAAPFLRQIIQTVRREEKGARAMAAQNFIQELNAFPRVTKHYPDKVKGIAKSMGVDTYLNEDLTPRKGVQEALSHGLLPEEIPMVKTAAEAQKLQPGTLFFNPNGELLER